MSPRKDFIYYELKEAKAKEKIKLYEDRLRQERIKSQNRTAALGRRILEEEESAIDCRKKMKDLKEEHKSKMLAEKERRKEAATRRAKEKVA